MSIERVNPYSQRLIWLPKKAKAEPEFLEEKKSPPGKKAMEKRIIEQEKLKKLVEQLKYEQAKMKQAGENMKAEQEAMKILITCLEIARRIMSGDEVPHKDHKYLIEHDIGLYARAVSLRRHKEDPHKYDQLSEDEQSTPPQSAMDTETSSGSESSVPVPELDVSV